jgi:parallel beta-helix repeat protein
LSSKVVSAIFLALLVISASALAPEILPVKADETQTIYINPDGSISPSMVPISTVDNITYTLTSDINGSIVVNKDSIIVDGASYALHGSGSGSGTGVSISGRHGVTVRNMTITGFDDGIELVDSSGDTISANTVMNNGFVVVLNSSSDYNIISENDINSNDNAGIGLYDSSNNTLSRNNLATNDMGIALSSSSNCNTVFGNNVSASGFIGLYLGFSSCNSISGNNIIDNFDGMWLVSSSSNMIFHNNVVDNRFQIGHSEGSSNAWDDGYPSGGNYWSDYTGVDLYRGAHQNETGGDGIGDTPYVIENDEIIEYDNYPLVHPWSSLLVHNIKTGVDYTVIQDAINAPETGGQDTIFVESGTYLENLVINKSVLLIGESAAKSVLDGSGKDTMIHVTQNNVTVTGFTIQNSGRGVFLDDVSGCKITQNNITGNGDGIFGYGDYNIISNNSIFRNNFRGIDFGWVGHELMGNGISGNVIDENSYFGIQMVYGSKNVIMENNMSNQKVGLEIYGASSQQNTVNDNIFQNDSPSIYLYGLPDVNGPSNNTIAENTLESIRIEPGENNAIYHNNFLGANPVTACDGNNTWDYGYPSGGNYWSPYEGTDLFNGIYQNVTGGDGIGDTQYIIGTNNTDRYPLVAPLTLLDVGTWNGTTQNAEIESNSTLLDTQVDVANKTISFSVTHRESTSGFCRVTMPNAIVQNLWQRNYSVLLDNEPWLFKNWTDATSTYIYVTYSLQFPNVTNYSGDLAVNGSQTLLISNCEFNITGRLIISDQGEVILSNCTFVSNWNETEKPDATIPGGQYYWRTRQIVVEEKGRLNISDSNVTLLASKDLSKSVREWHVYYHAIAAYDEAEITMVDSTLSWNGDPIESMNSAIYLEGSANLVLANSSISTFQHVVAPFTTNPDVVKNFVSTDNSSTVYAANSVIDQIIVSDNSSIQLVNCTGDFVAIPGGTSQVWLTTTKMSWIDNLGSPRVWLNNSTVTVIDDYDRTQRSFFSLLNTRVETLYGYGEIRLDNSQVKELDVDYARAVFAVWHLPILGQVLIPYSWSPYIIPTIALTVAVLVVGIALAVRMKHRRSKQGIMQGENNTIFPTQEAMI